MKELEKNEQIKVLYIFYLFILLIARSIGAYSLLPSVIDSVLFAAAAIGGAGLILKDFISILMKKKKFTYNYLLIAFTLVMIVASLLQMKYGITANIKTIAWSAIYFFLIYEVAKDKNISTRLMNLISKWMIAIYFILSSLSLVLYLMQYSFSTYLTAVKRVRIGFVESRLFGVYGDPNYASIMAIVVVIFSLYFLFHKNITRPIKLFLMANIVIQLSYIALSGSRTSLVCLVLIAFLLSFGYLLSIMKHKSMMLNVSLSIVTSILFGACVYYAMNFLKMGLSFLPPLFSFMHINSGTGEQKTGGKRIDLSRKDVDDSSDISNLRFAIWKSSLDIFKTSWLFGTSPRNMISYAREVVPNTYLADIGFRVHNSYLDVLTSTGILGAITLFSFYIQSALSAIVFFFKNLKEKTTDFNFTLLSVITIALSGFFLSELVLVNTVGAFIFWLFLGRLVFIIKEKVAN